MLELSLDRAAELVDLGPRNIPFPSLALKRNGHPSESDFQHAVPVDASVFRTLGHGHLNEAVGGEQVSGEVLELAGGKFVEPVEQLRPELKLVRPVEVNEAGGLK